MILLLVLMFCPALPCFGQTEESKKAPPSNKTGKAAQPTIKYDFWIMSPHTKEAAAVEVVAARDPITTAALLVAGKRYIVWGLDLPPVSDEAPELNPQLLHAVRDDRPFPNLSHKLPEQVTLQERAEIRAYAEALVAAAKTPPAAFAHSAKENKWVTWGHLYRQPEKFRGKVIPVKGKLMRLRRMDPPWTARKRLFTLKDMYEGWIFTETARANPVCVMFTELPKGVEIGEKVDYKVELNGYFFKRYWYISGEGPRKTLFFIAPTFRVLPQEKDESTKGPASISETLTGGAIMLVIIGGLTFLVVMGINWWYRRDDARIHNRLSDIRAESVQLPGTNEPSENSHQSAPSAFANVPENEEGTPSEHPLARRFSFPEEKPPNEN